jgi:CMP-N,N'-diacetyllegionaminic acid synthase
MKKNNFYIIIPARKNSKRIPNKNLIKILNSRLIEYTIHHAKLSKKKTNIFISSDDLRIKKLSDKYKVNFTLRSKKNSQDKSTTESAILETINQNKKKIIFNKNSHIVLLQCTSPIRFRNDIDKAIKHYIKNKLDSLFSGCENKNLFWGQSNKKLQPINYNIFKRKREQSMQKQFIENGSIYIFNLLKFLKYKNRLFGKIGIFLMNKITSIQIDDKEDVIICRKLLK